MSNIAVATKPNKTILNFDAIRNTKAVREPFPHIIVQNVLPQEWYTKIEQDFPDIKTTGFLPLSKLERMGAFDQLISDLQSPELAAILTEKLQLELRDKPRMITVRKWSAGKDGRIHNDGEAKICTSLVYLNKEWPAGESGALRVLRSETDFEDYATEIPPVYGSFFAFARTEDSWHGHKPFTGERRVIQTTWLRSQEDLDRKEKRGALSLVLKKLFVRDAY